MTERMDFCEEVVVNQEEVECCFNLRSNALEMVAEVVRGCD